MRDARGVRRLAVFLAFFSLSPSPGGWAQTPEDLPHRLLALEERLQKIEIAQQEILDRDEKIRDKLDELRIWAHRRPSPAAD